MVAYFERADRPGGLASLAHSTELGASISFAGTYSIPASSKPIIQTATGSASGTMLQIAKPLNVAASITLDYKISVWTTDGLTRLKDFGTFTQLALPFSGPGPWMIPVPLNTILTGLPAAWCYDGAPPGPAGIGAYEASARRRWLGRHAPSCLLHGAAWPGHSQAMALPPVPNPPHARLTARGCPTAAGQVQSDYSALERPLYSCGERPVQHSRSRCACSWRSAPLLALHAPRVPTCRARHGADALGACSPRLTRAQALRLCLSLLRWAARLKSPSHFSLRPPPHPTKSLCATSRAMLCLGWAPSRAPLVPTSST